MPDFRQSAGNAVATDGPLTCTVALDSPTVAGSLVIVIGVSVHSSHGTYPLFGPSGFSLAAVRTEDELTVAVWYRAACPALTSVSVLATGGRGFQVRCLEYTGAAQSNVLDKVTIGGDDTEFTSGSSTPNSGATGTISQADEIVVGIVANRHASTVQSGFTGGLAKLTDTVTPNERDDYRSRVSVHQRITTQTASFALTARLSTSRDWVAIVLTFRGGSLGPMRMTSLTAPPVLVTGGRGDLTVFGPLVSKVAPPMVVTGGAGRIGPFEQQFRLGGWTGLLIGKGTDYRVERVEGIGGWDVRTADGEFPRGDGAQRGVDLQAARQILVTVNFDESPAPMEQMIRALYAALVPQRDEDWPLMFRLPGQPLQQCMVRPTQLVRELNAIQMLLSTQSFALRAADPRIYSARERTVEVPVSPGGTDLVDAVSATNEGNARAYPVIRIDNRATYPVTSIQLVNVSADVAFEVAAVIPPGGQLVGDMPARVTAAPRSVVTLDGQSKYGSWQPPREPFYLAPDPIAVGGVNALYLRTTPAGAPVVLTLEYRDTWAG